MYSGSFVALVTPFDKDGRINYLKIAELIDFHKNNGTDGIVLLGTTGEAPTVTEAEAEKLILFTLERVGDMPLIIGCSSNDTRAAVEKARRCEALGAKALLVLTPYYNKANDMDRLINELTVYSGIDSNRIPYHFHKINVSEYFGDCVEEVGLDLESKNIELNYSNLAPPDTQIIADPEQLKRVINNIIGNSIKYLDKPKGEIDIRILDEVDSIRIEIEDNGKGIAAKDLPKIFERFYRTDASRNSSKGGSGIGLSIVKKIVEDHGGYIWATSKEGEGTCMHFVFRKYQETA